MAEKKKNRNVRAAVARTISRGEVDAMLRGRVEGARHLGRIQSLLDDLADKHNAGEFLDPKQRASVQLEIDARFRLLNKQLPDMAVHKVEASSGADAITGTVILPALTEDQRHSETKPLETKGEPGDDEQD